MKKITYTWSKEFTIFEPGDKVEIIYPRSEKIVYIVEKCDEPQYLHDNPKVYFEGFKEGYNSSHYRLIE